MRASGTPGCPRGTVFRPSRPWPVRRQPADRSRLGLGRALVPRAVRRVRRPRISTGTASPVEGATEAGRAEVVEVEGPPPLAWLRGVAAPPGPRPPPWKAIKALMPRNMQRDRRALCLRSISFGKGEAAAWRRGPPGVVSWTTAAPLGAEMRMRPTLPLLGKWAVRYYCDAGRNCRTAAPPRSSRRH